MRPRVISTMETVRAESDIGHAGLDITTGHFMIKKAAIIFDHDGTLVDSIACTVHCTNKVLEQEGFAPASVEKIKHGMAFPTVERFGFHTKIQDRAVLERMGAEFYKTINQEGLDHLKLYAGIRTSLTTLARRGYALGMVTNNEGRFVRRAAARLAYAYDFSVILGEENVPAPKPFPDGLLQACAGLGALPENSWYIGDGKPDFEAARAASMKCGLVSWGAHPRKALEELDADILFDDPKALVRFFE